jgi:hypothetical protein
LPSTTISSALALTAISSRTPRTVRERKRGLCIVVLGRSLTCAVLSTQFGGSVAPERTPFAASPYERSPVRLAVYLLPESAKNAASLPFTVVISRSSSTLLVTSS